MFEQVRQSFRDMLSSRLAPEDRRAVVSQMKGTLIQARVGLKELEDGVAGTSTRVENERRELDTVRRRKAMAEQINDAETVTIASRYEIQVAERVRVFELKLAAQLAELEMVKAEVEEMTTEFKSAATGSGAPATLPGEAAAREVDEALDNGAALQGELDALGRAHSRARRDADADERLAELKRRMGK